MTQGGAISLDNLRERARRRVPRIFFDYADGGALRETALRRNRQALDAVRLWPRAPRDVSACDTSVEVFGETLPMPLAIAPIGLADLVWPGMDMKLASGAAAGGIPHILSTAASTTIEDVAAQAGAHRWFQLYTSTDPAITDDLLSRAAAAGYRVLVVTVDVAAPGRRYRDLANGFRLPMAMGPAFWAQLARCPAWALAALGRPVPRIVNLERYAPESGAQSLAAFMAAQISASVDLDAIRRMRARWSGPLVVKGVMHPDDAVALADIGVDGVIVSNHGGRQLDAAPAAIEVLPHIAAAAGARLTIIADGGVRSGEDIARMLACGARMVLAGRPFLWSVAATGGAGAVLEMLRDEFRRALGQIGCPRASDLGSDHVVAAHRCGTATPGRADQPCTCATG